MSDDEAMAIYGALCEGDLSALEPHPAVQSFYEALYARHPEIDDVPAERLDDQDYCPWSGAHDRSDRHVIMTAVWSQADKVAATVGELARQHRLALYDPQAGRITYPDDAVAAATRRWWKLW